MFRFTVCFVVMAACLCTSAWASGYGAPAPLYGAGAGGSGSGTSGAQVISLPANVEAQAAALTNAAGAKATAAKINALKWDLLNLYGYEIGYPLLVKKYGPLSSLYSASLPPRSFVGKIDPAFLKDSYGKIKYVGESTVGVAAI
ncbi:PREDICTED: chorion protein S16 [Rhagoletis zephyria]|uniref:chorion protein S16 n=1 Tax=Rhagoletis zephyria TaxID=28612 RepID=UPI000811255A|nr:PREDICTED: chorion protein S16 [Rhagoletis zephyria]XP_036337421.1 chorion protein S16 [Rhagoletis pomonella]